MIDLGIGERAEGASGSGSVPPESLRGEQGLELAYERYRGEILGYAVNALADQQLAEDVVQETFVRAWRSADRFDPARASLRTWLFAIARNGIVDAVRRRNVRARAAGASAEAPSVESAQPDPIERLLLSIQVDEALRRLSPEHRQVVVEVYCGGRTCADLSKELAVPAATLRSRLYYGVRALRGILEENGWMVE